MTSHLPPPGADAGSPVVVDLLGSGQGSALSKIAWGCTGLGAWVVFVAVTGALMPSPAMLPAVVAIRAIGGIIGLGIIGLGLWLLRQMRLGGRQELVISVEAIERVGGAGYRVPWTDIVEVHVEVVHPPTPALGGQVMPHRQVALVISTRSGGQIVDPLPDSAPWTPRPVTADAVADALARTVPAVFTGVRSDRPLPPRTPPPRP